MSDDQGRPRMGASKTVTTMSRTKTVEAPLLDPVTIPCPSWHDGVSMLVQSVTLRWWSELASGREDNEPRREGMSVQASGVLSRSGGYPLSNLGTFHWPDEPRSPWPDWLRRLVNERRPAWVPTGGESNG